MVSLEAMEQALVAPCMESVIAVTERYQYLEEHHEARVFTAIAKWITPCVLVLLRN